jgi:transketolase
LAHSTDLKKIAEELHQMIQGDSSEEWNSDIPMFSPDAKSMTTRVASEKVMNRFVSKLPIFISVLQARMTRLEEAAWVRSVWLAWVRSVWLAWV